MKKLFALMFAAMFAMSFVACGDDEESVDNQASCENWLDSMECGDYDFSAGINCAAYKDITCDISDYFDCLTENTTCVDGVFGVTADYANCANAAACD